MGDSMEVKSYQAGDVIFREHDFEEFMYDVLQGTVGIYANYGTEQERLLTELSAGELFGEMGMLEAYPRSATAVALSENTQLRKVDWQTFERFFIDSPDRVYAVMIQLSKRIRSLSSDYVDVCRAAAELTVWEPKSTTDWLRSCLEKCKKITQEAYTVALEYSNHSWEIAWYMNRF